MQSYSVKFNLSSDNGKASLIVKNVNDHLVALNIDVAEIGILVATV